MIVRNNRGKGGEENCCSTALLPRSMRRVRLENRKADEEGLQMALSFVLAFERPLLSGEFSKIHFSVHDLLLNPSQMKTKASCGNCYTRYYIYGTTMKQALF